MELNIHCNVVNDVTGNFISESEKLDVMVLNNGTFSDWHETIINTFSQSGNDALELIYLILVGWFVYPLAWLRECKYPKPTLFSMQDKTNLNSYEQFRKYLADN